MLYLSNFQSMTTMRFRHLAYSIFLTILLVHPASAKLYKWVDEQGKTHYTDKIPPEHAQQSRSELNDKGIEINKVDRAKTAAEIAQEKELERLRLEQEKIIEKQKAEDRVLLRTFRSEDDIIMAMNGKITAIDVMIQITKSNIKQSKEQLADMQDSAATMERMGKKPSAKLLKDIASTRQQLKNNYAAIINREKDKERIKKKGEEDLARFRELKKLGASKSPELKKDTQASQIDYIVDCSDAKTCDNYWQKAKEYTLKHTTTKVELSSESVITSASPKKDADISITLSRIAKDDGQGEHIFFDLQCKSSKGGDAFCESKEVKAIKSGFKGYVLGGPQAAK